MTGGVTGLRVDRYSLRVAYSCYNRIIHTAAAPASTSTSASARCRLYAPARTTVNEAGGIGGYDINVAEYTKVGRRSERENDARDYRLEEVFEESLFSTDGWPVPADSFLVAEAVPDTVAGLPVYRVDFTLNTPERQLVG